MINNGTKSPPKKEQRRPIFVPFQMHLKESMFLLKRAAMYLLLHTGCPSGFLYYLPFGQVLGQSEESSLKGRHGCILDGEAKQNL